MRKNYVPHPKRGGNALKNAGQKSEHQTSATTTKYSIARFDKVCSSLAILAFDLAALAHFRQTAHSARLATDAYQLAERAHNLADALAAIESEVAA